MTMHWIDWSIVGALGLLICVVALRTRKYTQSVADFLSANRCAGKYLVGVADGIAALGAVTVVAWCEMYYKAGFSAAWWQTLQNSIFIVIAILGWIQYRYRQTRAMTMAQFFEVRYSRRFRIFAGLLAFVAGTFNFAIFPAAGGRFFQYFCGLPNYYGSVLGLEIDLVFAGIMLFLLALSLSFTLMGGQIAVMVTDFIQGAFCNVMFVVISCFLLWTFSWEEIGEAIATAPQNASLINPVRTSSTDNFDMWFFIIAGFGAFYSFMAWQGNQGYYSAAKTPHDAKIGRVIGQLRPIISMFPIMLMAVGAYTYLHHPAYVEGAAQVESILDSIKNPQIQSQVRPSVALSQILPVGLLGALAAVMFGAFVSTHDTYLHTWGSIFVQDVLLPVRNTLVQDSKPLTRKQHLRLLRFSIAAVAVFIFLFSLLFNQQQDIMMFFALTGTIYLGWSGAAIIGGLYWKRGTTAGAWSAAFLGMFLALLGWYMTYYWGSCQALMTWGAPRLWAWMIETRPDFAADKCPWNAQWLYFWTMVSSAVIYILVSLISWKDFNLDRMLHRGRYAREGEVVTLPPTGLKVFAMGSEYTMTDRCLCLISYAYALLSLGVFVVGTLYALSTEVPDSTWMVVWKYYSLIMLLLAALLSIWFAIGGVFDFRLLLQVLKTAQRSDLDDGTVVGNRNLDDLEEGDVASVQAQRKNS